MRVFHCGRQVLGNPFRRPPWTKEDPADAVTTPWFLDWQPVCRPAKSLPATREDHSTVREVPTVWRWRLAGTPRRVQRRRRQTTAANPARRGCRAVPSHLRMRRVGHSTCLPAPTVLLFGGAQWAALPAACYHSA